MPEVRLGPHGHVAIKTGPGVTAGEWFIFHPDHGGGYSSGENDHVTEWPTFTEPPSE